jgi:hypothetical protein
MIRFIYCANAESAEKLQEAQARIVQHMVRNEKPDFWVFELTPELEHLASTLPQCFISNKLSF